MVLIQFLNECVQLTLTAVKDQQFSQILKYFKDFLSTVVRLNSRTFEIYCDVQDANQTPQLKMHIFLSVVYLLRQCFFY